MPVTNAVEVGSTVPPLETSYHCMLVPVADRLAIVGKEPEQNVCVADPVGAEGVAFTTTVALALLLLPLISVTVTVYAVLPVEEVPGLMDCVVAPVFHE